MQSPEALLTIAQIAVAFAGFASIITAVSGRDGIIRSPANLMAFRVLIYSSLAAIGFSLLPFAFLYMGVLEPQVWLVCISILAPYLGVSLYFRGRMAFRLARKRRLNPTLVYPLIVLGSGVTCLQLAVLADVVSPSIGPYFLGLCYILWQAAVSFAGLAMVSIKGDSDTNI